MNATGRRDTFVQDTYDLELVVDVVNVAEALEVLDGPER